MENVQVNDGGCNRTSVSFSSSSSSSTPPLRQQQQQQPPVDQFTLLNEIMHMWGSCVFTPATTNLRGLAMKGLLKSPPSTTSAAHVTVTDPNKAVLTLPVSLATITDIFLHNKDLLLQEYASDPGIPFHIQVLTKYREKYSTYFLEQEYVVAFDDENKNSELVYGILVNNALKRITLVFRGSVSAMDYKMDFKIGMNKVFDSTGREVYVHRGFSTYLLDPKHNRSSSGRGDVATDDDSNSNNNNNNNTNNDAKNGIHNRSKFDDIKRELDKCCQQFPDYRLYVTGHSLGGSLALIAAFKLAPLLVQSRPLGGGGYCGDGTATSGTPQPLISCCFSPLQVGDIRFRQAFQRMEREGLINNLNVINRGDLVPLYPLWNGTKWYRFVGNKLKLANLTAEDKAKASLSNRKAKKIAREKTSTISRAPEADSCFVAWLRDIPNQVKYTARLFRVLFCEHHFWLNHTVTETTVNLESNAEMLEQLTWDDLYNDVRPRTVERASKSHSDARASIALPTFVRAK